MSETPAAKPARQRRKKKRLSRHEERRRRLLRAGLVTVGVVVLQPLAFLPWARRARARLRPPGALPEQRFLGACIKCGQCVQVCPVQAILLADADDGLGHGSAYIDPRAQACDFSCDALSCILACPTGALSHDVNAKEEVAIGRARLARPETCLARKGEGFRGVARGKRFRGRLRYPEIDRWRAQPLRSHPYDLERCDLCVRECPIGESAIGIESLVDEDGVARDTPVVRDGCVGCGVCEMICPQEPGCIVIDPAGTEAPA